MSIYYLIFIFSFLFCIIDYFPDKAISALIYIIFCSVLIILPGLREVGVDNDSNNYLAIFQSTENYSLKQIILGDYLENTERGYMLLNKFVSSLGGSVNTLFIIVALFTGILNYSFFFFKVEKFAFTALLFYLSFFYLYRDFTQIRYGLSCAIAFWSVHFLLRKRYILFISLLFLSILFHNTSLILILVLPICFLIKNKYFYVVLPAICLIGLFFNPFPIILNLGGVPEHMAIYLNEDGAGGLMISAFGFFLILLYLIINNQPLFTNGTYDIYFRILAIGVALNLLFIQSAIFQRFSFLLFQFGVVLIPAILKNLQKGTYKMWFVLLHLVILLFLLYYGVKLISPNIIRPYFNE